MLIILACGSVSITTCRVLSRIKYAFFKCPTCNASDFDSCWMPATRPELVTKNVITKIHIRKTYPIESSIQSNNTYRFRFIRCISGSFAQCPCPCAISDRYKTKWQTLLRSCVTSILILVSNVIITIWENDLIHHSHYVKSYQKYKINRKQ